MPFKPSDIILNKYHIEELIGKGAFAEVFRAKHMALNAPRALKILRRDAPGLGSTDYSDFQARFQMEAQLGARLDHPNVVRVHDFEQDGDTLILVMEYAQGGSLAERLAITRDRNEQIPIREALKIALDIAQGLSAIHVLDAVHRDLKPSNILFDKNARVKVADIGLAQIPGGPSMRSELSTGVPHPGTPSYMSPEQESTSNYLTPASDVYALGLVLFEMLTGRVYRSQRPGTRASLLRTDTPAWLDDLLASMLAKDPEKRPWDGSEVTELLLEAIQRENKIREEKQAQQEVKEEVHRETQMDAEHQFEEARIEDLHDVSSQVSREMQQIPMERRMKRTENWIRFRDNLSAFMKRRWRPISIMLLIAVVAVMLVRLYASQELPFLPAATATPTSTHSATLLPKATNTFTRTPTSTNTVSASPTAEPSKTPSPSSSPTMIPAFVVVSVDTNCRSGPGSDYELVGALVVGEQAKIIAQAEIDEEGASIQYWIIENPDKDGLCWLWGEYASVGGDTWSLPVITPPPTPTETISPAILDAPMVLIPAGFFQMGGDVEVALAECERLFESFHDIDCSMRLILDDVDPIHTVTLGAFYIDPYEVTNAHFAEFLNTLSNQTEGGVSWLDSNASDVRIEQIDSIWYPKSGYEYHPVTEVTWYGASAYCKWRGARLPTEAEWEKAARGGLEGKYYPNGDLFNGNQVNFCDSNCENRWANPGFDDGFSWTAPVGRYDPNGYGLYDVAGNVWEWVSDWYYDEYYSISPSQNPSGPTEGANRVARGGSWFSSGNFLMVASRFWADPADDSVPDIGFRCAMDSKP